MRDARYLPLIFALALCAACAVQKSTRHDTEPAKAKAGKPTTPQRNHAPPKNTGLPAGEVGYYMDVLQGRLQQQLDPAVVVARENDSIVLDFSRRLAFTADTTQLNADSRELLAPLAKILGEYRAALVLVRVSAEENAAAAHRLAQLRAGAIERILIDAGTASVRIAASATTTPARDGEAHVEIVLVPETRGR